MAKVLLVLVALVAYFCCCLGMGSRNDSSSGGYDKPYDPYASKTTYDKPSYDPYASKTTYDKPSYDPYSSKTSYDKPSYDPYATKTSYDTSSYGSKPSYDKPSYTPTTSYDKPSYDTKTSYDKPSYDTKTSYDKPSYDTKTNYDSKTSYDKPTYTPKLSYDTPSYDSMTSYDKPSYGKTDYGKDGYGGDSKSAGYAANGPSYGPAYGPVYGPGYGYGGKSVDIIDRFYERIDDVIRGIKFAAEALDAMDARLSLIKKLVDELTLISFAALTRTDQVQNNDLTFLEEKLDYLKKDLDDLFTAVTWLEKEAGKNTKDIDALEKKWSSENTEDTYQDGAIAVLFADVRDLKDKLFQVLGNEFALFDDRVEAVAGKLNSTKTQENARMCETGTVTLKSDDRRAEYVFQSHFDSVPGVLYSLTGLSANLDVIKGYPYSHGYGYGYDNKDYKPDPSTFGSIVLANPSKKSVTFQLVDTTFGDTAGVSVDVDFQACTIGPGGGVPYGYKPAPLKKTY